MTKYILFTLLSGLFLPAGAETYFEWTFDDEKGTNVSKLQNSGSVKGNWSIDLEGITTDGKGQLSPDREPNKFPNSYVEISSSTRNLLPDVVYLSVEIDSWDFKGNDASEAFRVGLAESDPEMSPRVLAQIRIERTGDDQVSVAGDAFGDGSYGMSELPLFEAEQKSPVHFVLKVQFSTNRFELFMKDGKEKTVNLGEGQTSPGRVFRYLRLGFFGHFTADNDEEFLIDRIALMSENPLAEK